MIVIQLNAQVRDIDVKETGFSSFDEVPVEIVVEGKWNFETNMLITDSNLLFINVKDLFTQLKIVCNASKTANSFEGFIVNENKTYSIDYTTKLIKVGSITINSKKGLLEDMGVKYIETSVLSEAFGLTLTFNPRSLSAKLISSFELPYLKQLRLENTRSSISKLQGEEVAVDTIIPRYYNLFKGGMLDWAFNSNQTINNKTSNNLILGVGSEFLFGEANISVNYNNQKQFDNRQLQYSWRWLDNDKKLIKQVRAGKIFNQSIAFLSSPIIGATVNNSPNTVRKATGTYTINDYTEPNWIVELYINDVLVDFTTADASGLYVFNVPIVYGYTTLRLKFYGPLGEERTEERIMNTPYTFIPAKTIEYSVSAGVLEDNNENRYGRGDFNYGLNRFITVGGGLEYLSSISNHPFIPFAKVAFQPFSKMIVNLEYDLNVRMKGLINYYFIKSAFLEVDYTKYVVGQLATRFNALEERKVRVSVPFKINSFSGFSKLNFSQFVYQTFNFNQLEFVYSAYYRQLSINSSTLANWVGANPAFVTTNLSLSYRTRNGLVLRPSVAYNLNDNTLARYRAEIEQRVSKMYFSISYERNVASKSNTFFLNCRYDLPYARAGLSAFYSNNNLSFTENIQGSLAFGGDNYTNAGNNSSLSKGGILFYPFIDLNQNGIKDKGEKMILLSSVRVTGGTAVISKKDSIIRVSDLNAFVNYTVEFLNDDLESISWKFKHNTYQVLVDPNQYKKVFVPIIAMGEVNGMVYLKDEKSSKGLGRVTIQIYDTGGKKIAETLSEFDGYFSYLGLKPGKYSVVVDEQQLKKLNYQSSPKAHETFIEVSEDGTIVDGLDFNITVKRVLEKSEEAIPVTNLNLKTKKLLENPTAKSFENAANKDELFYSILIGVYKDRTVPKELQNLNPIFFKDLPDGNVEYYYGFFRVRERAVIAKNGLILIGIKGTSLVTYQLGEFFPSAMQKEEVEEKNVIPNEVDENINSKMNTSFSKISDQRGLFYSVQVGVFKKYVPSEYLLNFIPVFYEFLPDGTIRYISGKYESKTEARAGRNKVIKRVKEAYIVKYKDGKKVDTATGGK